MNRTRRAAGLITAAILAVGPTSGCSPEQSGAPAPEPDAAAGSEPSPDAGTDQPSRSGATADVGEYTPDDAIVSQDVSVPGSAGDTVTIGVHSLTVEGDVQVLRLLLTPHFASLDDEDSVTVREMWSEQVFSPRLVDMTNLKVYSPVRDDVGRWTSDAFARVGNGGTLMVWAVFAAPEDDIETLDVRVEESWPEFTDVPITH